MITQFSLTVKTLIYIFDFDEKAPKGVTDSWKPERIDFSDPENQSVFEPFVFPPEEAPEKQRKGPVEHGKFLAGEYQGFGEHDLIDDTFRPEWRT